MTYDEFDELCTQLEVVIDSGRFPLEMDELKGAAFELHLLTESSRSEDVKFLQQLKEANNSAELYRLATRWNSALYALLNHTNVMREAIGRLRQMMATVYADAQAWLATHESDYLIHTHVEPQTPPTEQ